MISVIYETPDFIAVNKPAGVLTHQVSGVKRQDAGGKTLTLADWVLEKYPEVKNVGDQPEIRPGIVHRLDRDTSGIILIARNQKFFEYLKKLFQTRQIRKTYLALVWGKPKTKTGVVRSPIGIKSGSIRRTVWQEKAKDLKEAITEYRVVKSFKRQAICDKRQEKDKNQEFSLLEVSPKTGRTHQIRIHLASIGHPIVGDAVYGCKTVKPPFALERQFLHAFSLEFSLPAAEKGETAGRRLRLEAELPEELSRCLEVLKKELV